jgi:hypothetical protein
LTLKLRISDVGFQVPGFRCRILGFGFHVFALIFLCSCVNVLCFC